MKLQHFAQMRALESAYTSTNQGFVDHLLAADEREGGTLRQNMQLKRIQFDAAAGLADELDSVCGLLDCSKRQFLEGAVWEALDKAKTAYFQTLETVADEGGPQLQLTATED
jgi:hypothetical protein